MSKMILVVDDDAAILDSIKMILELENYIVQTSKEGETIYKMKNDYPDLLLLDIWMSGQDGRDVCKYLKQNPLTKNIPIIMVSASRDIMQSAKEAGADDFITKPFEIDELLSKVAKYVDTAEYNKNVPMESTKLL